MLRIEPLSREHGRENFTCGADELDRFLKQTARRHAERGLSRTFVLVDDDTAPPRPVTGFFSLNVCQVMTDELPAAMAARLPRQAAAVRLGRLAVARSQQQRGYGKILLMAAIDKFVGIYQAAGGIGLFVDAKDLAVRRYYEQFGFVALNDSGLLLFLPLQTILRLTK